MKVLWAIESAPEELIAPPWADPPVAESFEKVDPMIVTLPAGALPIAPAEPVDELPESVLFCTMSVPRFWTAPPWLLVLFDSVEAVDGQHAVVVDRTALEPAVSPESVELLTVNVRGRLVPDAAAESWSPNCLGVPRR